MRIGFHTDAFNSAYWFFEKCLAVLRDSGYQGVLSIECEGQSGPMIEQSLAWLRRTLAELGVKHE